MNRSATRDPKQVRQNRESGHNQRALRERVIELGLQKNQITLMDEDQGRSAEYMAGRDAFQKLAADVGLRRVGMSLAWRRIRQRIPASSNYRSRAFPTAAQRIAAGWRLWEDSPAVTSIN
jgi:hypothetical protein